MFKGNGMRQSYLWQNIKMLTNQQFYTPHKEFKDCIFQFKSLNNFFVALKNNSVYMEHIFNDPFSLYIYMRIGMR